MISCRNLRKPQNFRSAALKNAANAFQADTIKQMERMTVEQKLTDGQIFRYRKLNDFIQVSYSEINTPSSTLAL